MERRLSFKSRYPSFRALSEVSVDFQEPASQDGKLVSAVPPDDENSASLQAKRDARKVFMHRAIFVLVLCTVAIILSIYVYTSASSREREAFETHFEDAATKITLGFERMLKDKLWTAQSISTTMTSSANHHNDVWPNVLIPDFNLRMEGWRVLAESSAVVFSPIVTDETRASWEAYILENQNMMDRKPDDFCNSTSATCRSLSDGIYSFNADGVMVEDSAPGPYHPGCLISAAGDLASSFVLFNYFSSKRHAGGLDAMMKASSPVITGVTERQSSSTLMYPIFDVFTDNRTVVGSIQIDFDWKTLVESCESVEEGSIVVVVALATSEVLTFEIFQHNAEFLGPDDYHDSRYDSMVVTSSLATTFPTTGSMKESAAGGSDAFSCTVSVYPTRSFELAHTSNQAAIYTAITVGIFSFVVIMFLFYNGLVERRSKCKEGQAQRPTMVLRSFFPLRFRARNFGSNTAQEATAASDQLPERPSFQSAKSFKRRSSQGEESSRLVEPAKARLRTFLSDTEKRQTSDVEDYRYDEPIADLFPETTVMFADIAGFTAWSSEREPSQVFYLLETLYRSFDKIASRLGVFKVETIGDCYVAVTGLPDQRQDHAIAMARFSYECMLEMSELVKSLEVTLGPGTSDLAIRVGLHSGPVTAGVLRGEKARFQLFGDTMNTAARMESTGEQYKIHVSQDTADALQKGGKGHWLTPRDAVVNVKGKGQMKTWWLQPRRPSQQTAETNNDHAAIEQIPPPPESRQYRTPPPRRASKGDDWGDLTLDIYGVDHDKRARLVNWNVEILSDLLAKVVAWRSARCPQMFRRRKSENGLGTDTAVIVDDEIDVSTDEEKTTSVIDEVSEIINLPVYTEKGVLFGQLNSDASNLPEEVKSQLHHYISRIASFYHNVPFHNLEHASHVSLSANKLMKRIISPAESDFAMLDEERRRMRRRRSYNDITNSNLESVERNLHHSTFGISSDPLCQLAIVFSALIHDVDHTGLPNAQLIKENRPIAKKYKNKSVAEQNSVDIAWEVLMEGQYQALRDCIFGDEKEKRRFRQLVVNSVMATDIVDKELKMLRENRWATAFDESKMGSMSETDVNRKATIVIEHIIQASDVAHTMQHWHIYCKWNEKLFCELYTAYLSGRAEKDPSVGWYGGEIWFFDNYIIPLAKKLKECGVFGVASDEYLSYAEENRKEWERKGHQIVEKMKNDYLLRHGDQKKAKQTNVLAESVMDGNSVENGDGIRSRAGCFQAEELKQSESEYAESVKRAKQVYAPSEEGTIL